MTEDDYIKDQVNTNTEELNDICDECKKTDESVTPVSYTHLTLPTR